MSPLPATNDAPSPSVPEAAPHRIDVAAERARTSGSTRAAHFNAAGSALPSVGVVSAVVDHLRREEAEGGYEAAAAVVERVDAVYRSAARLIGADAHHIALVDSASTGLRTIVDALRLTSADRIVAARSTYVSHALHLLSLARERDIPLVVLPVDATRRVDLEALDCLLSDGVRSVVTVAHVPTSSGLVEPAAEIGAIVRRHGGVYLLDATQSVGHLAIDVREIGCDVLVTTGRKFLRAPRGTGFAYVGGALAATLEPAAPDVRGARWTGWREWENVASARRFETWESSIAGRLGLGVALDETLARGVAATESWLVDTSDALRRRLAATDGVTVVDPTGARSAIVTFTIAGVDPAAAVRALSRRGVRLVAVPDTHGRWDLADRGVASVVRASPHVYNDADDLAALVDAVGDLASGRERIEA